MRVSNGSNEGANEGVQGGPRGSKGVQGAKRSALWDASPPLK